LISEVQLALRDFAKLENRRAQVGLHPQRKKIVMITLLFFLWLIAAGTDELPVIKGYDFSSSKVEPKQLINELSEASGLTFTMDGRLLCHNDEQGIIYDIDYRTGNVRQRFYLGKLSIYHDDLEGIAAKQDTIFMVTSSGKILRFLSGKNEEKISFEIFETPLTARNNVEGLAYDPATDCLLLACKDEAGLDFTNPLPADLRAVYAFSLKTYKLLPEPRFLIPISKITARTGQKDFRPSSIERDPRTGNFFILAAKGKAIVEIDPNGKLLGGSSLPKSVHKKPEGIALAPDRTVVICNEGGGKKSKAGRIVVYPSL
jgi:uncharacterized protein YjiK